MELKPRKENECPFCRGEFTHLSTKATGVYPEKMYECENCGKVTHHSNDKKALEWHRDNPPKGERKQILREWAVKKGELRAKIMKNLEEGGSGYPL